jgi:hypothetical protein
VTIWTVIPQLVLRSLLIIKQDANLKRCFGREEKIIDCDWSFLKTLRTTREPHEPMPRLMDLLEYLAMPGLEDIWILLDIKVPWPALSEPLRKNRVDEWKKLDNNADDLMRLIASTIAEVKPSRPWNERVILGCWAVGFVRKIVPLLLVMLTITSIGQVPSSLCTISP